MTVKLLFIDLEGTLLTGKHAGHAGDHGANLWARVFTVLGPAAVAADEEGAKRFDAGEFSYIEWCEYALNVMRTHGLTKTMFDALLEETPLSPHVAEFISEVKRRGIRVAIISGGFSEQAERVQRALGIPHALAASRIFWTDDGRIQSWNVMPSDYVAKVDFVELLRKECNLPKEACAFIGDGKNDVAIASHVGLSFAYNAHPKLQQAATHAITDFRDALKYL